MILRRPQFFFYGYFESPDSFLASVFVSAFVSVVGLVSVDAVDADADLGVSVEVDLRLSLMYQPDPLKIIPAG